MSEVAKALNDWIKIVNKKANHKDVWTTIPSLPQYKFKNLKLVSGPFETTEDITETTITLKYDVFKNIKL